MDNVQMGIWCPWAEVLCGRCHDGLPPRPAKRKIDPDALPSVDMDEVRADPAHEWADYEVCKCERCGARIALESWVARCASLRDELCERMADEPALAQAEVSLEQTGGMCCATAIRWREGDGSRLLYATAFDGPLTLCSYERLPPERADDYGDGFDWEAPELVAESEVVADVVGGAIARLRSWCYAAALDVSALIAGAQRGNEIDLQLAIDWAAPFTIDAVYDVPGLGWLLGQLALTSYAAE
jgi:hypothetical protein